MAILFMLGWWYGRGWGWAVSRIGREIAYVGRLFAVKNLLKTWAAPWKQITAVAGSQTFIQRFIDNSISRLIGFIVRSVILLIALLWAAFMGLTGLVLVALWPLIPLMVIVLPLLYTQGVTF